MSDEKKEITMQDIDRRLAALETAIAFLTAERNRGPHGDDKKSKTPISFESIGGKFVLALPKPVKGAAPIDMSPAYGATGRCVLDPNGYTPAATAEKDAARK